MRRGWVGLLAWGCLALGGWAQAQTVDFDAYQGKVIYVDFWASWCGPCRQSFPWMTAMQEKYRAQGLAVIAINLDQDRQQAEAFLKEFKPDFQIAYDQGGKLAEQFKVSSMPSSFLIDRHGKARLRHAGFHLKQRAAYEDEIKSLLTEP